MLNRRGFLKAGLGLPLLPAAAGVVAGVTAGLGAGLRSAHALGLDAKVGIALLDHGGGADLRPMAVEQLMWETSKRTSIDVLERPGRIDLQQAAPTLGDELSADARNLFRWPLLVWIGDRETPPLSERARTRLERFLRAGGTLFIDDASPIGDDRFDRSVRAELARVWPAGPLQRLPADHTLYKSFFLLERSFGRIDRSPHLEGIHFDDHSVVIYSRNDLFGAFGRDRLGQWLLPVLPRGAAQREMAFRVGVNLLMYATCLNYKRDQVHTTAILRRRRWRTRQR